MLKVGIIGAAGYTGRELIKILLRHPKVKITSLSRKDDKVTAISDIFPVFKKQLDLLCSEPDLKTIDKKADLLFLSLPHMVSMQYVPKLLEMGKRIVDLSADYRLKDESLYESWYNVRHSSPRLLASSVYGLPELYRKDIAKAKLVANPGCYPTASILGCIPMLKESLVDTGQIIIDAKSGITGAGRTPALPLHFAEANENFRAYKVNRHQHMPEINQELSRLAKSKVEITFVPHIVPMSQGMLVTIYFNLKKSIDAQALLALYKDYYKTEPFVRILKEDAFPETAYVTSTNFCDIGIKITGKRAVVIAAIDNLWKGASAQAVQNMNIMEGFEESAGLL